MNGSGTEQDPWQVATYAQLAKVARGYDLDDDEYYEPTEHYKLVADIDASPSETANWNEGDQRYDGWTPLPAFGGVFDGAGHSITGLYINRPNADGQGLFGPCGDAGAVFRDLALLDVDIVCGRIAGSLAATVIGNSDGDFSPRVERIYVSGTMHVVHDGIINASGGIVGVIQHDTVLEDCVSHLIMTTDLSASNILYRGGVVGRVRHSSVVQRCYATGRTSEPDRADTGSVVGFISDGGAVEDCFYDINAYEQGETINDDKAVGKTTAEMQDIDTYTNVSNADLDNAWDMVLLSAHDGEQETATWYIDDGNDYPRLWFEYVADEGAPMPQYIYGE